jgi:predicted metal-dependent hydrolase
MTKRIRKKSLSELDRTSLTAMVLSTEEKQALERGITLFNSRRFWEAHEVWEGIWQNHPEDGRFFIQALIQLAAGYHQLLRRIYRGFVIHMRRARERLELFPATFLGIDVDALLTTINRTLEAVNANDSLEEVDFSRIEIPRIANLPSQNESGWSRP